MHLKIKNVQVDVELEAPAQSPEQMVALLDRHSQQELMHAANVQLRSTEARGLLWLLDEECAYPAATDDAFAERLFVHYGAV